jgi:hypothetical protein
MVNNFIDKIQSENGGDFVFDLKGEETPRERKN